MKNSISVLGLPYFKGTAEEARNKILSLLPMGGTVFTPNAEMAYRAIKNPSFSHTLASADLLLPDGQGIVAAARFAGEQLTRIAGVDIGLMLLESGAPIFFLGGKPGVADAARQKIAAELPKARIVGTLNGYFSLEKADEVLDKIRNSGAEILFVCLGSPKQEEWIRENRPLLPHMILMGLGGSLDIYAGNLRRAPLFFQKHGLEWLYRLIKSPKRLYRMRVLPLFLWQAWKKRKLRKKSPDVAAVPRRIDPPRKRK